MAVISEAELPPQLKKQWLKAVSAVQTHNYEYAIQLLNNVLQNSPAFLEGRKMLRRAQHEKTKGKKSLFGGLSTSSISVMKIKPQIKKDPMGALASLEKILENEPMNVDANLAMRDAALGAEMPELAQFTLESVSEAHPKDVKLMHELGRFYIAHEQAHKAVDVYNRILEINPHDMDANKLGRDASARASMAQGGWDTAESYRDLIKDKEQAISLEQQSRVTKSDDMIENQLHELGQQYDENPQNVDVVRKIAGLYEQKADLESAITWYEYARQLTSGSDPVFVRKVGELRTKQTDARMKELQDFLDAAGDEHPEAARVREELDELKRSQAELKLEEARARVERNPTDLNLRLELGQLLLEAGNFGDAIKELQQAKRNPAGRYKAMSALARCYTEKGMLDIAQRTLEEAAVELKTMDDLKKGIVYQLGVIYSDLDKPNESLEAFKQIYEVDYGYRDVAERVEAFYEKK